MAEMGSILDFLDNKSILVTGATGFLAKIFVEKILRVQPNVKKLYLLVRAADAKSALQRFNTEAVAKDLFKLLKEKYGTNLQSFLSEKVTPVAGDITKENLGIKDDNLIEEMWRDVDVVVNVAATTNFDERYDIALALNAFGARNVFNFAAKCVNIKLLLHVSTAYVSGEKPGLILETPYRLGEALNGAPGLDIDTEKRIIDEKLKELSYDETATEKSITLALKDLGIERANKFGWPNTYVFTKALGEMILGHLKGNMPLVILRPTIILSTYKEPFPGWIEGVRTIDSLALGYGKGRLSCFLGDPESTIDVIPADMVVNAMITTMVAHANQPCEMIYHVGSSVSNPLKYKGIQESGYEYFTRHPWVNKSGKPVIVGEIKVLNSMESFHRYFALRYMIPLQGLSVVNSALCHAFNGTCTNLKRKINFVLRVVELYKPYLFSKSFYDDMNTEKLRRQLVRENGDESNIFYFDPKSIDWYDYFVRIHLPGAVKYVFK
uniref:fatty acyl-CoA reductase 3-like n=1 Tax=Erigeron canadensis TaxID=72917 RepID=UPI001CB96CFA|nr:fatty acyl-CoA reductase 3-like [Erigeron canadensis]